MTLLQKIKHYCFFKKCTKCGKYKHMSKFSKSSKAIDLKRTKCKQCDSNYYYSKKEC